MITDSSERPVVLLGGGGHAAVCADVLTACGWTVEGYFGPPETSESDLTRLGSDEDIRYWIGDPRPDLFVAVGDNALRLRLTDLARDAGWRIPPAVSPRAAVSPSATIGRGALVMPGAILNAWSRVGEGAIVNSGAVVEHHVQLGQMSHVAPHATLTGRVVVGERAFVGAGATVIPGVRVGDQCVVGAGATVTRDIASGLVVVGTPARPVRVRPGGGGDPHPVVDGSPSQRETIR